MLYPHIKNPSVYNKNYVADFYIFNGKNKKYESKAELDTIPNLNVCKKSKYLISNDGVALRKYIWKGDSLIVVETIKQTELENGLYKIRINNIQENKHTEYTSRTSFLSNFHCE